MSLSSALNTAVAALTLTSKRAETVANNVANADRPGYARRSILSASPGNGLPPTRTFVERDVDPRLVQLRRDAEARAGQASVESGFLVAFDAAIGDPDQAGSLQDRLAAFDAAILAAGASPASDSALSQVAYAASDVIDKLDRLSNLVQQERQAADTRIGDSVRQLNTDLAEIARLNTDILRQAAGDGPTADLMDRRTVLIDRVSEQIPVRILPRDGGTVALVSQGGQILLDGRPAELEFTPRAPITPEMSFPTQLSGLTINGNALTSHGDTSLVGGGTLSALFALRDDTAPAANAQLDGLAQELVHRFSDPAIDPTLPVGAPGLFTDRGAALASPVAPGLASRLTLNAAIDPGDPSTLWRLRDGLGALVPSSGASAGVLAGFADAFHDPGLPVSPAVPQVPGGLVQIASALKSAISVDRVRSEALADSTRAEAQNRLDLRDGGGVDIDAEMQRLLRVEQAYAANARLVQAAGEMMDRLTEL
ncbi:MAG: flagellar basal body rod C-terminal domain-containing protein [Pseudomonadota bacterium]